MELITVTHQTQGQELIERMDKLPVSVNPKNPTGFLIEISKYNSATVYAWRAFNCHGKKLIRVSKTKVPEDHKGKSILIWREK